MFYFAYGANLNLDNMKWRCPNAKPVCTLTLPNYQLVFRGVADIEPNSKESVDGVLWWITDKCEDALDVYEGYPHLYRKESFVVKFDGGLAKEFGEINDVMFYAMNRTGYGKPSIGYYETIEQGYIDNDLDISRLEEARDFSDYKFQNPYVSKIWGDYSTE